MLRFCVAAGSWGKGIRRYTNSIDAQGLAANISCLSTDVTRKCALTENAPEIREALEKEALEEMKASSWATWTERVFIYRLLLQVEMKA